MTNRDTTNPQDGVSTMAAAGTGFHLAGGRTFLPTEKSRVNADAGGDDHRSSAADTHPGMSEEFNDAYRLYASTRLINLDPKALEDLRAFARSEAGERFKPQMLDMATSWEGQGGLEFMRDYVYAGSEPQIDWRLHSVEPVFGARTELLEALRPAAQQLIGLTEATVKAQTPAHFEQKLSALARNADPDVQSFLVQYGESSNNPKVQAAVRDALRLPNFEQPRRPLEEWRPRQFQWLDVDNDTWRSPDQRLKLSVAGDETGVWIGNHSRAVIDAHLIAVDIFQNAYEQSGGLSRAQPPAIQAWLDGLSDQASFAITQAAQSGRYTMTDGKTMIASPDMPTSVASAYDFQIKSSNAGPNQPGRLELAPGAAIIDPRTSLPVTDPRVTIIPLDKSTNLPLEPRPNVPLDDQPDDVIRRRADEARRRRSGDE